MKKLLLLILCFLSLNLFAQQAPFNCGFDALHATQRQNPATAQLEEWMNSNVLLFNNANRGGTLVIPIVVHIIHNNGPENINDAQVLLGIQQMNADFANTNIQFCLAQQTPTGGMTTGINRVVSTLTNMNMDTQDLALKNLSRWDPTRYMNIWLVAAINSTSTGNGVVGYAYFPTSHGTTVDGLVCEAAYFGSNGPNASVVGTHEVGHYLGLYHTFEGGCGNANCQQNGDRVCDTPPDNSTAVYACNATPNTCTTDDDDLSTNNPFRPIANGGSGDQPDAIGNHMDYGDLPCHIEFSTGQADRMFGVLNTARASLLASAGCQPGCPSPVNISFTASNDTVIIGNSLTFTIQNPNGNYAWSVNGVAAATGNSFTYTFNATGSASISVVGTNNNPDCIFTSSMVVSILCNAVAQFTLTPPAPYLPGVTINTNNTSINATSYKWYLDGVLQTINTNFSQQFNQGGGHNVYLIATNSVCSDTSSASFFQVGDCSLKGFTNNWYLQKYHLSFSTSPPTLSSSPNISLPPGNLQECTSVMSDINGNTLFYCDGDTVWDRNHNPMPNGVGILGGVSSTMGSIALPYPGSTNLYYLFTTAQQEFNYANGTRYNVIDMNLNNGLGDIVQGQKNILVRNGTGEKMTATYHGNGRDIWVVVDNKYGETYYAYLITPAGVSTTPVITSGVGGVNTNNYGTLGGMKLSHDGNKIAMAQYYAPYGFILADFNKWTGQITNDFNVNIPNDQNALCRSFEFSPDNSKLYVSMFSGTQRVLQYNLAAGSPAQIIASEVNLQTRSGFVIHGELCLGNDDKVYLGLLRSNQAQGMLDYFENPNLAGVAAGYTQTPYINAIFALPNLLQGRRQPSPPQIVGPTELCLASVLYNYSVANITNDDSIVWSYTGPGTFNAVGDSATLIFPNGQATATMSIAMYNACGITYDTIQITLMPSGLSLGNDTVICNSLTLSAPFPYDEYLWSTGAITPVITINQPGTYWLETENNRGCTFRDTIVVSPFPQIVPVTITAMPAAICSQQTAILNTTTSYESYVWTGNFVNDAYTAFQPGNYWVTVSNGCYTDKDTITVSVGTAPNPVTITSSAQSICNGESATLIAGTGYSSYEWHDGSGNDTLLVNQPGTYWVIVSNGQCTDVDSITLQSGSTNSFNLTFNGDTVACKTALPFVLTAPSGYVQYLWQGNTPGQTFAINSIGNYWLTVTDGAGCSATDTFRVEDCTGITEEIANGIRIYPNPVANTLYMVTSAVGTTGVKLYNAAGQIVLSSYFIGKTTLPMQQLPNGLYIAELVNGNTVLRKKVLVME